MIFRIYLTGMVILLAAIALNALVNRLGIMGWYDFLLALGQPDGKPSPRLRVIDGVWLFLMYPLLLGGAAVIADRLLRSWGI